MNVRRGFDRLSLVLYGAYLVALAIQATQIVNSERSFWLKSISQHEVLCHQLAITPATRREIDKALEVEKRDGFRPDLLEDLHKRSELFPITYLTADQEAEYRRALEDTTLTNALKELFASRLGWTLVVLLPLTTYGCCLAVGYAASWVYRGFHGGNRPV
jgi:hypothetical protein